MAHPTRSRRVAAALALLLLAGLWSSLHHALWLWPADPDLATPWLIWHQVLQDGPRVLLRWRYAQDNWLLSLVVPDFALFALAGTTPLVVLLQGWGVYVAACALLAVLLHRVAGPRVAALAAILPLLAGPAALGRIGFLTYATSHAVSLLWGLAALACAATALRSRNPSRTSLLLAAMLACQAVGGVSDPWLAAALTLPTLLAALLAALVLRRSRARLLAIAATTALAMWLVSNRLLMLHALPGGVLTPGPLRLWPARLAWILRYVAALFQAVPLGATALPVLPLAILDTAAVLAALLWSAWRLWHARARLRPDQALLALAALLSIVATPAAFVVSDIAPEPGTGRFLMNLVLAMPLLLGCAWTAGAAPARPTRVLLAVWAALLAVAGALAAPAQLLALPTDLASPWTRDLATFLDAHDLHEGYGGFWGSQASAVTWLTRGRVALRAVEASPAPTQAGLAHVEPRLAQSFPSWFPAAGQTPAALPARTFFVAQPSDELCPTLPACLALADRSFGPADQTLQLGPLPILVWNRAILQQPTAATVARAPALHPGETLTLGAGGDAQALLWLGWSRPEPAITWTQATRAVVLLHLPDTWSGDAVLEVEASAQPRRDGTAQPVDVIAHDATDPRDSGTRLATWTVQPRHRARYAAVLPWSIARSRLLWLQLDIPGAEQPSRTGGGFDPRALGLSVRSLTLRALAEPIP